MVSLCLHYTTKNAIIQTMSHLLFSLGVFALCIFIGIKRGKPLTYREWYNGVLTAFLIAVILEFGGLLLSKL